MSQEKRQCNVTTQEFLAIRFPNSYHLIPELENVCGIVKTQNRGKAHVSFEATGIDYEGKLIVKCFEAVMKFFRRDN